jgi:hypothetical protein
MNRARNMVPFSFFRSRSRQLRLLLGIGKGHGDLSDYARDGYQS